MTPESGFIQCRFDGSPAVMEALFAMLETADRQNQFSCGLSWLDEVDRSGEVESGSVSYDTLAATQEFLSVLLTRLPELRLEGHLEHSWPTLPCKVTIAEFSSEGGCLRWEETCTEPEPMPDFPEEFFDVEDEDTEIEIPLTPYD